MARKKNSSVNWLDALTALQKIIRQEYNDGGKLPPVPEMAARLNVAENTYCKALQTICQHGLATAVQGRAGTIVRPRRLRPPKIGILYPGRKPLLPQIPLNSLFRQTIPRLYEVQMVAGISPKTLRQELLLLNIGALYAVKPTPAYFTILRQLQEEGFPLAAVLFDNYSEIQSAAEFHFPYFHVDTDHIAKTVYEFAARKHYSSLLQMDQRPTMLTTSFTDAAPANGMEFDQNHFVSFSRITKDFLSRIKKKNIDLIYAKCNLYHAEQICTALSELPPKKRPAILFPDMVKGKLDPLTFPDIKIAGYFDQDTPAYETAAENLVNAVQENHPVQFQPCKVFCISENHRNK